MLYVVVKGYFKGKFCSATFKKYCQYCSGFGDMEKLEDRTCMKGHVFVTLRLRS